MGRQNDRRAVSKATVCSFAIAIAALVLKASAFVPVQLAKPFYSASKARNSAGGHRLRGAPAATLASICPTGTNPAASTRSMNRAHACVRSKRVGCGNQQATADAAGGEEGAVSAGVAGDGGGATAAAAAAAAASAATAPPRSVSPSYRRLYDAAIELLEKEMVLEDYPIPEGLESNSAVVGKGRSQQSVKTTITAFRAPKIRQIRSALVETDGPTQVLNFVVFPDPSYDLPIFGADLVSLPGVHLVCIDLQPAYESQKLDGKIEAALQESQRRHLEIMPAGGELPEATRKFFSSNCLWCKIGSGEDIEQRALDAMMDYLREFLSLARQVEPEKDEEMIAKIALGHADYCSYRRENDPARGMLTRFYGSEWTESAIEGILFDFKA